MEEAGLGPSRSSTLCRARAPDLVDARRRTHVDVFLGEFAMCHRLDLDGRLAVDHPALPAADLLLMKLQVIELNRKDVTDVAALLSTHRLGDDDEPGRSTASASSRCWPPTGASTRRPATTSIASRAWSPARRGLGRRVAAAALREEVEAAPKTRAFKLRAQVGRRKRWYEVPDDSIT